MSEETQPERRESPIQVEAANAENQSDPATVRPSFKPQQRLLILGLWDRSELPAREVAALVLLRA